LTVCINFFVINVEGYLAQHIVGSIMKKLDMTSVGLLC